MHIVLKIKRSYKVINTRFLNKLKEKRDLLIKKILHEQDSPDSQYGREWRWWITSSLNPFNVALERQLIRWEGKPTTPRPVDVYCFSFFINPLKWSIKNDHMYYDGNHCSYQFGPLGIYRHGFGGCKQCYNRK